MSATLGFYWAFGGTVNGVSFVGENVSMLAPVKEVTIPGDASFARQFTVPANTASSPFTPPTLLWSWDGGSEDFELLVVQIMGGEGYARVSWFCDSPASDSDATPTGDKPVVHTASLSCHTPFILNTDEAPVHATLSTAAGLDGDGFPAILTQSGTTGGKVYNLWVQNTSTTESVSVMVWMRN